MGARSAELAVEVLESLRSGVVAVDRAGRIALINDAALRMLVGPSGSADSLLGVDCERALSAHPAVVRLLRETLAGRAPLSRAELRLETPGRSTTLGFSITVLRDAAGALRGAAMWFRDLAPIERSGERERLRERLAALGEMAAGLAHEIRNPLAGMELVAGLLQRRLAADPDSRELLADLREQIRQLSATVTESLAFLRPVALDCEPLDAAQLVDAALEQALQRAPRPAEVRRRFASPLPKLHADRRLLGSAIANLIANACEAMEGQHERPACLELAIEVVSAPECAVAISAAGGAALPAEREPARELRIDVGDTGPGIPDDVRDKIFDPFFTTRERGSGIGLAHVQKIVTGHGGALSFESSAAGSVFRVHLPLGREAR